MSIAARYAPGPCTGDGSAHARVQPGTPYWKLAEDTAIADGGGWGGITLAHNVRSREEVDEVMAEVAAAGGTVLRAAQETFWGGYSGVFADPEGHPWEVGHGAFRITDDGDTVLKGA